jgi:hypothetical protein
VSMRPTSYLARMAAVWGSVEEGTQSSQSEVVVHEERVCLRKRARGTRRERRGLPQSARASGSGRRAQRRGQTRQGRSPLGPG